MNVKELKQILIAKKINPLSYNFIGKWENEDFCLVYRDGMWEVYYSERGNRNCLKRFSKEEEACQYFFEWAFQFSSMKYTDKELKAFAEGRFQLFKKGDSELSLMDTNKRRILGEQCKYICRNEILYVKEKLGYIVIDLLKETIKQLQNISENKFVWGGEYGEEYKKINKFEEFSEEEKIVLRDLK